MSGDGSGSYLRVDDDSGEDDPYRTDLSPRVVLAKLKVHTTYQREQLEAMHAKLRLAESAQSSTANRIESLESSRKLALAVISTMLVLIAGSLWTAYTASRDAGARDGRIDTRIEQLERGADKAADQIQSLWRARVRAVTGDLP